MNIELPDGLIYKQEMPAGIESSEPTETIEDNGGVLNQLYEIRQRVHAMGANDQELPNINLLIERYIAGELSGAEALEQVQGILDNKSEYH